MRVWLLASAVLLLSSAVSAYKYTSVSDKTDVTSCLSTSALDPLPIGWDGLSENKFVHVIDHADYLWAKLWGASSPACFRLAPQVADFSQPNLYDTTAQNTRVNLTGTAGSVWPAITFNVATSPSTAFGDTPSIIQTAITECTKTDFSRSNNQVKCPTSKFEWSIRRYSSKMYKSFDKGTGVGLRTELDKSNANRDLFQEKVEIQYYFPWASTDRTWTDTSYTLTATNVTATYLRDKLAEFEEALDSRPILIKYNNQTVNATLSSDLSMNTYPMKQHTFEWSGGETNARFAYESNKVYIHNPVSQEYGYGRNFNTATSGFYTQGSVVAWTSNSVTFQGLKFNFCQYGQTPSVINCDFELQSAFYCSNELTGNYGVFKRATSTLDECPTCYCSSTTLRCKEPLDTQCGSDVVASIESSVYAEYSKMSSTDEVSTVLTYFALQSQPRSIGYRTRSLPDQTGLPVDASADIVKAAFYQAKVTNSPRFSELRKLEEKSVSQLPRAAGAEQERDEFDDSPQDLKPAALVVGAVFGSITLIVSAALMSLSKKN